MAITNPFRKPRTIRAVWIQMLTLDVLAACPMIAIDAVLLSRCASGCDRTIQSIPFLLLFLFLPALMAIGWRAQDQFHDVIYSVMWHAK